MPRMGDGLRIACSSPFCPSGSWVGTAASALRAPRCRVLGELGQRAPASVCHAGAQHCSDQTVWEWADKSALGWVSHLPHRASLLLQQQVLLAASCSASTDPVLHVCHHSAALGFPYIHAAADGRSAGWAALDALLSCRCCLLGNYFPRYCMPLQVREGVCAEQLYFQAVNSCGNSL